MTDTPPTVSVLEAAARLDMSEATVRRRIKEGKLRAHQRPIPGGYEWRITLPDDGPLPANVTPFPVSDAPPPVNDDQPPANPDGEGLAAVIERMHRENLNLAAVAAMWQERARNLEQRVLLLEAGPPLPPPPEEPPAAVESAPTEDVSHTEAQEIAPQGIWARVVAFWRGGA